MLILHSIETESFRLPKICALNRQRREIVAVAVLFQRHFGRRTHGAVERRAGDVAAVPRKADDRLARLIFFVRLHR